MISAGATTRSEYTIRSTYSSEYVILLLFSVIINSCMFILVDYFFKMTLEIRTLDLNGEHNFSCNIATPHVPKARMSFE
jgi:hypothetical protein